MKWKAIHDCSVSTSVFGKQRACIGDRAGLGHDDLALGGQIAGLERLAAGPSSGASAKKSSVLIRLLVLVTSRESSRVQCTSGQGRLFKRQNGPRRVASPLSMARQFENARDIVLVGLAVFREAAGVEQVVVAAGKAKAGLARAHDIAGGIFRISADEDAVRRLKIALGHQGAVASSKLDTAAIWSSHGRARLQPARPRWSRRPSSWRTDRRSSALIEPGAPPRARTHPGMMSRTCCSTSSESMSNTP